MTREEFAGLLRALTGTAEAGDGERFARCFTEDAVYHDYIYGDHRGRAAIAEMLENFFHRDAADYRWEMFDPVCDGALGYAWSLSTFTSKLPEFAGKRVIIDGMSRFELQGGLIRDYSESVNAGVAMAQLGVAAPRMEKVMQRWARELRARPAVEAYLARCVGDRAGGHP
ncbi:MAG TPA: nuclear transport factor 2 family protein [Stellaceae bacterium]|nr:nuclear transport factor 2 family protein [Stellaceae bacterium]